MSRLLLSAIVLAFAWDHPVLAQDTARPWRHWTKLVGASKEIEWSARCNRVEFDFANLIVSHSLASKGTHEKVRFPGNGMAFRMRLAREGSAAIVKDFRLPIGHWSSPATGQIENEDRRFCRFTTDLRSIVGPLSPGAYTLTTYLTSNSFYLDESRITANDWIEGPTVEFRTVQFDPAIVPACSSSDIRIELQINQWERGKGHWNAQLVNDGNTTIEIWGYVNSREIGSSDFLLCPCGKQKLVPGHGWTQEPRGICGTGLGTVLILPGKSQSVAFYPVSEHDGNGVYRVTLPYAMLADKTSRSKVYTQPFLVTEHRVTLLPDTKTKK